MDRTIEPGYGVEELGSGDAIDAVWEGLGKDEMMGGNLDWRHFLVLRFMNANDGTISDDQIAAMDKWIDRVEMESAVLAMLKADLLMIAKIGEDGEPKFTTTKKGSSVAAEIGSADEPKA